MDSYGRVAVAGDQNLLAMRGLHMSKAKIGIALGLIVIIGCASSTTVEPRVTATPDVPKFATGEAIALVKDYLAHTFALGYASGITCWGQLERASAVHKNVYGEGLVFSEFYQGYGVWWVVFKGEGSSFGWRVYEGSLAVGSLNPEATC